MIRINRLSTCLGVKTTSLRRYNNMQELNSDSLPARSFINSLFCQQMDLDWLAPYPTLPSNVLAERILNEAASFKSQIRPDDDVDDCFLRIKDSSLIDIGIPVDFGGDPGPPGATLMLKSCLIQGLATNLPFAFLYAAHSSAVDTILKYGTKKQIDIVSIDAVSGFTTLPYMGTGVFYSEDGKISGSGTIRFINSGRVANMLLKVRLENGVETYALVPKSAKGVVIEENGEFTLNAVDVPIDALIPTQFISGEEIISQDVTQYLQDTIYLLESSAVLGSMRELFDAASHSYSYIKDNMGRTLLKTDLVSLTLTNLMSDIYTLESMITCICGKRPWSSESLAAEVAAARLLANSSLQWFDELTSFLGPIQFEDPWKTSRSHLSQFCKAIPNNDLEMTIGLRGFQAALSQSANMEKRIFEAVPFSREFRRIMGWKANWRKTHPELVSFGYSFYKKGNSVNRRWTKRMVENLLDRTKKDGTGLFADEGNTATRWNKIYYEFACRDFAQNVVLHCEQYGSYLPEQQWIVTEMGKVATQLFAWGMCFGRSEKSHMAGVRGFELEKDLALHTMDRHYSNVAYNVDYITSSWYGDSMAPLGKQRGLAKLVIGEKLLTQAPAEHLEELDFEYTSAKS